MIASQIPDPATKKRKYHVNLSSLANVTKNWRSLRMNATIRAKVFQLRTKSNGSEFTSDRDLKMDEKFTNYCHPRCECFLASLSTVKNVESNEIFQLPYAATGEKKTSCT